MVKKQSLKTFVLDTNVLLHDPASMFSFGKHTVIIPIYVVEEIDNFKKELSERGRNARQISRNLDGLREKGSLSTGVKLPNKGILRVATTAKTLPLDISSDRGQDSRILAVALDIHESKETPVVFLTQDSNLRIRADAIGIPTENFESKYVEIDVLPTGFTEKLATTEKIDSFYKQGSLEGKEFANLPPNDFVILTDNTNPSHTAVARRSENGVSVIKTAKLATWGIRPKNKEQLFALDLLLDDSIKLVTLVGKAGTGKTLLAIAAGLQKVAEERTFLRLLVSRPIFPLGKDIGYLPGEIEDKLNPWMQPIFDNVEFLMGLNPGSKKGNRSYRELIDLNLMQIEPLTYIRGRSIASQYMIVDEAQNLTPHEVKTIISRAGEGTKIILTGDPEQIDNPYVDATNNGLIHVVNSFRNEKIAGHVKLDKGERSELSELATKLL